MDVGPGSFSLCPLGIAILLEPAVATLELIWSIGQADL
jgi:hypothetical protein